MRRQKQYLLIFFALTLLMTAACNRKPQPVAPTPPPAPKTPATPDKPPTPQPTISLSAAPSSIDRGRQSTLSWNSAHASSIVIDNGIGNVGEQGSLVISPQDSTTYTAVARGPGGEARASARVTVLEPKKADDPVIVLTDAENLRREIEAGNVKDVFFAFDKSDLDAESRRRLEANALIFRKYPNAKVVIEGHCDERGTEEYNLALGDRRAVTTRDYLVTLGVAASQLETISYGEERPFAGGKTEEDYALNRRAHFVAGN